MDLPFALTQARALDAVVRHGSFSRAAAELGLTQPAVSMQVRQLAPALGLPLVERMGKRAFATRAGELLLEHSARAVRELETAVQMLQRLRGRGRTHPDRHQRLAQHLRAAAGVPQLPGPSPR